MKRSSRPRGRNRSWTWLILIAVAAVWMVTGLLWDRPAPTGGLPGEITVAQAATMREQGSFVLDVRQPEEWAEVHIPGSTLTPLGELESRIGEVPRDREIVVVCRSGNRSKRGREILRDAGVARVASMAGGLTAWQSEGEPTTNAP